MFSKDVLLTCPRTGVCEIDVERIEEQWHDGATIFVHEENDSNMNVYQLVEYLSNPHVPNPNNRREMQVTISTPDAIRIIKDLHLEPYRDSFFIRCVHYGRHNTH